MKLLNVRQTMWASKTLSLVTAAGQSLSGAFDISGHTHIGIIFPAVLTAPTSNYWTFAASDTIGGTYVPLIGADGNEVTVIAAASQAMGNDIWLNVSAPFRFLKLRSGTSGSPTVQVAELTVKVCLK
jgi:hypothetical protein